MKRNPDESYEDYCKRRKSEAVLTRQKLSGTWLKKDQTKVRKKAEQIAMLKKKVSRLIEERKALNNRGCSGNTSDSKSEDEGSIPSGCAKE